MDSTLESLSAASWESQRKTLATTYRAPYWLPGGHLQTIYAYYLPQSSFSRFRRERWETPDGDFIDLDWIEEPVDPANLVVLFHGLEGCSRSHYALSLANKLRRQGWASVVAHSRGCSGEFNQLPRCYHAGDSAEIDWILRRLKKEHPKSRLYVVGISMGGNDLLKWLGEQENRALDVIDRAVAVSAPVDLQIAAKQLDFGWNKLIYTRDFLRTMKPKVVEKIQTHGLQLDRRAIRAISTFRQIDDIYTAPIHGFRDADDYWLCCSSKPWLRQIEVPTLIINARNDPFFPGDFLPSPEEVSAAVSLEYPDSGGHVGFVSGSFPGHLAWLPRRILDFFATDCSTKLGR
jgi:predicted alpha/beta-fold hydrolase